MSSHGGDASAAPASGVSRAASSGTGGALAAAGVPTDVCVGSVEEAVAATVVLVLSSSATPTSASLMSGPSSEK